jgi:hypothetical protein
MKSLDCTDIKAMLSGLVDGELDTPTQHQAERHLAGCAPCRSLVSQTERLNEMISMDAQMIAGPSDLPAGFEDAVLSRTVYAAAYHHAGHRWTSWLGWVAAAACLGLASAIWFLDQQRVPMIADGREPSNNEPVLPAFERSTYATNAKSWLYEGGLPAQTVGLRTMDDSPSYSSLDDNTLQAIDSALDLQLHATLSEDDAQTLFAAQTLIGMLASADLSSFADVDRVRQIAMYDEILPRLQESCARLAASDRPVVLAAESILLRVVQGPLSIDDLRLLRETVTSMDLAGQLGRIDRGAPIASSL